MYLIQSLRYAELVGSISCIAESLKAETNKFAVISNDKKKSCLMNKISFLFLLKDGVFTLLYCIVVFCFYPIASLLALQAHTPLQTRQV